MQRALKLVLAGALLLGCRTRPTAGPSAPADSSQASLPPGVVDDTQRATVSDLPEVSAVLAPVPTEVTMVSISGSRLTVAGVVVQRLDGGEVAGENLSAAWKAIRAELEGKDKSVPVAIAAESSVPASTLELVAMVANSVGATAVGFVAETNEGRLGWLAVTLEITPDYEGTSLLVDEECFFIARNGHQGLRTVHTTPQGAMDYNGLSDAVESFARQDASGHAGIAVDDDVPTHVVVETLHRLRGTSCDVDASTCRFPVVHLSLEPNAFIVIGIEDMDDEWNMTGIDVGAAFELNDGTANTSPPPPTPEPKPRVWQGDVQVEGALQTSVVRRVIRAHINEVHQCYREGLERDGGLEGRLKLEFFVGADGSARRSSVTDVYLEDEMVSACISRSPRGWMFPKPPGESSVRVRVMLELAIA